MTQEPCCCREIGERGANVTSARQRTCHRIGIHHSWCMHVSQRLVQPCTYAAAFQPSSRSNVRRIKMPASDPEAARSETAPSWIRGPALSRALRCIEAPQGHDVCYTRRRRLFMYVSWPPPEGRRSHRYSIPAPGSCGPHVVRRARQAQRSVNSRRWPSAGMVRAAAGSSAGEGGLSER